VGKPSSPAMLASLASQLVPHAPEQPRREGEQQNELLVGHASLLRLSRPPAPLGPGGRASLPQPRSSLASDGQQLSRNSWTPLSGWQAFVDES